MPLGQLEEWINPKTASPSRMTKRILSSDRITSSSLFFTTQQKLIALPRLIFDNFMFLPRPSPCPANSSIYTPLPYRPSFELFSMKEDLKNVVRRNERTNQR
ncbi:hypothetical protein CC2G_014750 [Coprinopsis cinerea AmutBmut pab1-1]|nr:hypothetical protein CC2G_014750 [Coprinopsis cinerea AmutBmut pab1-1]